MEPSHIDESAGVAASLGDDNMLLPWEGVKMNLVRGSMSKSAPIAWNGLALGLDHQTFLAPQILPPRSTRAPGSNRIEV
jgi:hypothetical protein